MDNTYEIPFESAESVKNLVGKTIVVLDGRKLNVLRWEGKNLILSIADKEASYPAMVILDQIKRGNMAVT